MLLYDWKKVYKHSDGSVLGVFIIFKMLTLNQIPLNKYDKTYKFFDIDFKGESFLVHPDLLLFNSYKHSYRDMSQYLAIASFRSLSEYLANGKITLDILKVEESIINLINENSLLRIEDDEIHFLYEEVNEKEIH